MNREPNKSLSALQIAGYRAHAATDGFQRRYARAVAYVREAFARYPHCYCSFSCGKDSSAMMWLVLNERPDCEVRMAVCSETRIVYPEIDDILQYWHTKFPRMQYREICYRIGDDGLPLPPFAEGQSMNNALISMGEFDACFVGVRTRESGKRAFASHYFRNEPEFPFYTYQSKGKAGRTRCWVLEHFTENDVWAVLACNDVPTLDHYYMFGESERTTLRITPEGINAGFLGKLRAHRPESWAELVAMFPELERYI